MSRHAALWASALFAIGCLTVPAPRECAFRCEEGVCPGGLACIDGWCTAPGATCDAGQAPGIDEVPEDESTFEVVRCDGGWCRAFPAIVGSVVGVFESGDSLVVGTTRGVFSGTLDGGWVQRLAVSEPASAFVAFSPGSGWLFTRNVGYRMTGGVWSQHPVPFQAEAALATRDGVIAVGQQAVWTMRTDQADQTEFRRYGAVGGTHLLASRGRNGPLAVVTLPGAGRFEAVITTGILEGRISARSLALAPGLNPRGAFSCGTGWCLVSSSGIVVADTRALVRYSGNMTNVEGGALGLADTYEGVEFIDGGVRAFTRYTRPFGPTAPSAMQVFPGARRGWLATSPNQLVGISPGGTTLIGAPFSGSVTAGAQSFFTASGSLWAIERGGVRELGTSAPGVLASIDGVVFAIDATSVGLVDERGFRPVHPLPGAVSLSASRFGVVATSSGGRVAMLDGGTWVTTTVGASLVDATVTSSGVVVLARSAAQTQLFLLDGGLTPHPDVAPVLDIASDVDGRLVYLRQTGTDPLICRFEARLDCTGPVPRALRLWPTRVGVFATGPQVSWLSPRGTTDLAPTPVPFAAVWDAPDGGLWAGTAEGELYQFPSSP